MLAPEAFGLFAVGWTLLRLINIAGHLGLDYGVISFGARYWQKDLEKLRSIVVLCTGAAFFSGALAALFVYVSAPWVAGTLFKKPELEFILQGFAFTFPLATMLRVLAAANSISRKMFYGALAEDIVQPAIQVVTFLIFFSIGGGLNAAVFSTVISYAISVIVGIIAVGKNIPGILSAVSIRTDDTLPVLRYSIPAIVGATLGALNIWGDRLIVGVFGTEEQTGIYQSISLLAMLTTILLSGIKVTIAPSISQMFHDENNAEINLLAKSLTRWLLYLALPLLIIIFIAPGDLLLMIFGPEYLSGAIPLLLLTVGQTFYIIFGLGDQFFLMTGRQKIWLWISAIVFLLTIILDAILIPRAGLIGAGFVSSLMMLLLGILSMTALRRYLQVRLVDIYHAKILLSAMASGLITYILTSAFAINPLYNIVFSFIISTISFIVFLFLTGMEPSDKILISSFLNKPALKRKG